jgi:cytidine deaminase
MVEKQIIAKILFCSFDELPEDEKKLVHIAKEAAEKAYAPYSNFNVGAAVILENGEIVSGNNQENAAYPSGLCAERVALFYANAKWPDSSVCKMAIAARKNGGFINEPIAPCGSCRQVLVESENRYGKPIRLLLYGAEEIAIISSATDLLPLSFGKDYLKK